MSRTYDISTIGDHVCINNINRQTVEKKGKKGNKKIEIEESKAFHRQVILY